MHLTSPTSMGSALTPPTLTAEAQQRLEALKAELEKLGDLLVAFSGGVDSTFLLKVAGEVLGERAVALTALSPSFPPEEREAAQLLAQRLGVRQIEVDADEMAREGYRSNGPDRCYFCKTELFELCHAKAKQLGFRNIGFGAIADDAADHRPGMQAAAEQRIVAPLMQVGLSKQDIRALSYLMELETWDKPSYACLASRIPYGTEVTVERLRRVGRAEADLKALGFRQLRVRDHYPVARIELAANEMERLMDPVLREKADALCREAGFRFVALDLKGYRTGALNEVLTPAPSLSSDGGA